MLFFFPQLLIAFLALATIRVYTELLSPVTLGQVMLTLSLLALAQTLVISSVAQSVFYIASKKGSAVFLAKFARSIALLRSAAVALVAGALLLVLPSVETENGPAFLAVTMLVTASGLALDSYRSALLTIVNVDRRNGVYSALLTADAILAFAVSLAILSIRPTTTGFLLAYGVARGLSYLLASVAVRTGSPPVADEAPPNLREILGGSLPLSLMGILGWCTAHLDRFVVASAGGTVSAGHYAVASSLVARPYGVLTSALTVKYKPALFRQDSSLPLRAAPALRRWCAAAMGLGLVGVLCFGVVAGTRAIEVLVGPMAPMVSDLLLIFAVAFTLTTLTHPIENAYLSYGRSRYLLSIQVAYLPFYLTLLGVLSFLWGTTGAAWARILSEGLKLPILTFLLPENR